MSPEWTWWFILTNDSYTQTPGDDSLPVTLSALLTVLVDEHAEGDAIGVEAVQEVLDAAADERVEAKLLLVLNDPLGHGRDHVVMAITDLDQQVQETGMGSKVT